MYKGTRKSPCPFPIKTARDFCRLLHAICQRNDCLPLIAIFHPLHDDITKPRVRQKQATTVCFLLPERTDSDLSCGHWGTRRGYLLMKDDKVLLPASFLPWRRPADPAHHQRFGSPIFRSRIFQSSVSSLSSSSNATACTILFLAAANASSLKLRSF